MPGQLQYLDDNGTGAKSLAIGAEFFLRNNNEFALNTWRWTGQTANATPTALTPENANLAVNTAYVFHGFFVARYVGASTAAAYVVQGAVKMGAAAANTALVGTPLVTAYEDTSTMDLGLTADTTNGRLTVTATGVAATTINWVGAVRWLAQA